jgi:hypothetical protein
VDRSSPLARWGAHWRAFTLPATPPKATQETRSYGPTVSQQMAFYERSSMARFLAFLPAIEFSGAGIEPGGWIAGGFEKGVRG